MTERWHNIAAGWKNGDPVLIPYSILAPHEWAKLNNEPEHCEAYSKYVEAEYLKRLKLLESLGCRE